MNIYKTCPVLEGERFLLRLTEQNDLGGLLEVYSDRNALPFFNSDNCDGDNFYYNTAERMAKAYDFWKLSYENGWFARLSIIDKAASRAVGTVELCLRVSEDTFNNMGFCAWTSEATTRPKTPCMRSSPSRRPVWRICWAAPGY